MLPNLPDLPNTHKPWAKTVASIVICVTIAALIVLAFVLKSYNNLRFPEIIGLFLLFVTIVPPNLAIVYPRLLGAKHISPHGTGAKSTAR
jgi:hypothetical protein